MYCLAGVNAPRLQRKRSDIANAYWLVINDECCRGQAAASALATTAPTVSCALK